MAPPVFHLAPLPPAGATAVLDGAEGRHAATVRRLRSGERVLLTDGRGGVADCTVTTVGRDRLELAVQARQDVAPAVPQVTVVQALPKGERSDLAVELATEAGVDAVVPWQAARCVARWQGPKADKGVQRWQSTATQAAKQSRRAHVPEVAPLHSTTEVAELVARTVAEGGHALVLHESAQAPMADLVLDGPRVLLVVGPEGGIADDELAVLTAQGAVAVHLGPTVLRTSTAAAVALGALGVLTPRWLARPFA
ncbi:16S rRNA (uracil(1498)-N(3))-methyltransferase [Rhodococcus sp. X156]|uniref:16S rRNA (uracil(1498)-N(3))-methyltransferase n=1 Tax=Rhodococcus sp. X156 TaxID=2499145 RepID=UPI000FD85242|nr:16S rRNA (uracil(1498)-N(3))-methyltransferase [Rhodococcus sp. X156]